MLCGVFASMAVATLLAEDTCLDAGGRVSDTAWACETASGVTSSLWALMTPATFGIVVVVVGLPVYFVVNAIGRRWIVAHGTQHG